MKIKTPQLSPHYQLYYREHSDTNTIKTTCDAIFSLYQSAAAVSVIFFTNIKLGVWWWYFSIQLFNII